MKDVADNGEAKKLTPISPKKISLVPAGFDLVITSAQQRRERDDIFRDRQGTFSSAHDRASAIPGPTNTLEGMEKAKALVASSGTALAVATESDALELYRSQKGLDEKRDSLLVQLREKYSFDGGIALLNAAAREFNGKTYASMEEVNADFPNLTKTELILFSLLKRFPDLYLSSGLQLDRLPRSLEEIMLVAMPNVTGVSLNGLEISLDVLNAKDIERADPYMHVGITGVNADNEAVVDVDFRGEVKKLIEELVPLIVKSQRLFERIWDGSPVSMQDGFSKMDRVALSKVLGRDIDSSETVASVVGNLTKEQLLLFAQTKKDVDNRLGENIVVNPMTGMVFEPKDLVRLVGLLGETPAVLFGDKPFEGYVVAQATGVLFIDTSSGSRDYYPFYPYYIREALQGLHYETIDVSKYHNVVAAIFMDVERAVEDSVFEEAAKDGDDPSILEGLKLDSKFRFGVDFRVNPNLAVVRNTGLDFFYGGKLKRREANYKMSVDEMKHMMAVLRLVPKEFLTNVKSIRKELGDGMKLEEFLLGISEAGHYDRFSREIVMIQHPNRHWGILRPEDKAMYTFTALHEIAHSAWILLNEEDRMGWLTLSGAEGINKTVDPTGFLTPYSKSSPEEDFAEHMAAYIFHADEFRQKTQEDSILEAKYLFLKELFVKISGQAREYPQISPYTLIELHGYVEQLVAKRELEDAIVAAGIGESIHDIEMRGSVADIVESSDIGKVEDILDEEEMGSEATVDEVKEAEDRTGYKRTMVSSLVDMISGGITAQHAKRVGRKIYSMIEDGEVEGALALAKRYTDESDWADLEEHVNTIRQDIDAGNDKADESRKVY